MQVVPYLLCSCVFTGLVNDLVFEGVSEEKAEETSYTEKGIPLAVMMIVNLGIVFSLYGGASFWMVQNSLAYRVISLPFEVASFGWAFLYLGNLVKSRFFSEDATWESFKKVSTALFEVTSFLQQILTLLTVSLALAAVLAPLLKGSDGLKGGFKGVFWGK